MLPSPNESTSVTVLMKDIYFMRYIMYSVIKYQVSSINVSYRSEIDSTPLLLEISYVS